MGLTYSWNIKGHDKILQSLERDIHDGNLAHGNLFVGPDGIGKFAVAKKMANILQCDLSGCMSCENCIAIERGLHADTIVIPNDGEKIKIEQMRDLIGKVHITRQSRFKIVLVKDIERMTEESANAFLKTLEDPPEGVLYLLTSSKIREVIPTIISRVRVYKFSRLHDEKVMKLLTESFPLSEQKSLEMATALSNGKPGKALKLLKNPELLDSHRKLYEDINIMVKNPDKVTQSLYIAELTTAVKETGNNRLIHDFLEMFELVLRNFLVADEGENVIMPREKAAELLVKSSTVRESLKRNVNTRMLLENLMFSV